MTPENQLCPKCNGKMAQGFTIDMGAGDTFMGSRHVSKWAPGAPIKSIFFKTKVPAGALPVGTFRCATCGYLESYAGLEFASKPNRQFSLRALFIAITVIAVMLGVLGAIIRLAN
jgi:hypothetical protein